MRADDFFENFEIFHKIYILKHCSVFCTRQCWYPKTFLFFENLPRRYIFEIYQNLWKNTAAAHTCTLDCSGSWSCYSASVEGPGNWEWDLECSLDHRCKSITANLGAVRRACSDGECLLACRGQYACSDSTFGCPAAQCF
jgi:hypothetical protein